MSVLLYADETARCSMQGSALCLQCRQQSPDGWPRSSVPRGGAADHRRGTAGRCGDNTHLHFGTGGAPSRRWRWRGEAIGPSTQKWFCITTCSRSNWPGFGQASLVPRPTTTSGPMT